MHMHISHHPKHNFDLMQPFLNKYAIRGVLLIFSSYWLAQLASHTYHGLND